MSERRCKAGKMNRIQWFSILKEGKRAKFRIEVFLEEVVVEFEDRKKFER
jgi:hypothetical protein